MASSTTKSGGDGQGHQREDVEAVAEQIHRSEGADDRDRHRDEGNHGRAHVTQEQIDNEGHQHDRDHQRNFSVAQGLPDGDAAVDGDGDVDVGRHRCFQSGQGGLHAVDGLDNVGAGLAEQDHQHRGLAVGETEIAHVLDRIEDLGHVRQPHRGAAPIGDHQRRVIGGLDGLIVGVDLKTALALVDRALGTIGIGRSERRPHIFKPNAVFEHGVRIELDAHCRQRRATDNDLADAADLRQLLLKDIARRVVHLALRQRLRRHRQNQDRRVGGVHFAISGIGAQAGRQVGARRDDRGLDVARGAVDVAIEVELQRDTGLADAALRGHLGDIGDLAEMTLQRLGDAGGDGLGAGARKLRVDRNGREVDLRQRRHRQFGKSQHAGERDAKRQQRGRDRPVDEWRGNVHSAGALGASGFGGPSGLDGRRPVRRTANRSK